MFTVLHFGNLVDGICHVHIADCFLGENIKSEFGKFAVKTAGNFAYFAADDAVHGVCQRPIVVLQRAHPAFVVEAVGVAVAAYIAKILTLYVGYWFAGNFVNQGVCHVFVLANGACNFDADTAVGRLQVGAVGIDERSVLPAEQSLERYFGVPLKKTGIECAWLFVHFGRKSFTKVQQICGKTKNSTYVLSIGG